MRIRRRSPKKRVLPPRLTRLKKTRPLISPPPCTLSESQEAFLANGLEGQEELSPLRDSLEELHDRILLDRFLDDKK